MIKTLTASEMKDTLSLFTECFTAILSEHSEQEVMLINIFVQDLSLMVPCYSLRPDKLQLLNDSIFNDTIITEFILDLSFRFFTLMGDEYHFNRLVGNISLGLSIDGRDIHKSIIPLSIAQSCPCNIFDESSIEMFPESFFRKYFLRKPKNYLQDFLINNKHIVVLYLVHIINQG